MPKTSQTSQKPTHPSTEPRQQPGLACEECRARKVRCDRVQPTCGTCKAASIICNACTIRQPRGPRRGHLRALQTRIQALERRLGEPAEADDSSSPSPCSVQSDNDPEQDEEIRVMDPSLKLGAPAAPSKPPESEPESDAIQDRGAMDDYFNQQQMTDTVEPQPWVMQQTTDASLQSPAHFGPIFPADPLSDSAMFAQVSTTKSIPTLMDVIPRPATSGSPLGSASTSGPSLAGTSSWVSNLPSEHPSHLGSTATVQMTELMKADLNDLYFDRVHLFAPILNKRRYFARAMRLMSATAPLVGLQHAMWTLAAWLGSQFRDIQKDLYSHTRIMLEAWELDIVTESPPIEQAQAWILLAIYEITQVNYQRGWLSAGRAFRLVQLMKLHEIDVPSGTAEATLSWVEIEERRRTFWMAYTLDRIINLLNQMPLTLNEHVILTRLPAPEPAFQRDRPVKTNFLSEVIAEGDRVDRLSSYNASIVLFTISGRCLSHQQQCLVERAYGDVTQGFLARHQWLDGILADKTKIMLDSDPEDPDETVDSMQLFASMTAQATILILSKVMQSVPHNQLNVFIDYEQRAVQAARNIHRLSERLADFSYFKVHPFTPITLFFCAEFAQGRRHFDSAFESLYDNMVSSLQTLSAVNLLADTCLAKLISGSMEGNAQAWKA